MIRPRVSVVRASIIDLDVEAIVNAANESLLGGGGVDGVIHAAAGPGLKAECRTLGGCAPGEAKITGGHLLKARYVIHTVGPRWRGGGGGEAETLAACYRRSLELATEHRIRTIAFPAISAGAFAYPVAAAAAVAAASVRGFLAASSSIDEVVFSCITARAERAISAALRA